MKKLSISVFAVLAIVFAVTSAYTTNSKLVTNYEFYGLVNDAVTDNLPTLPSASTVTANDIEIFYTTATSSTTIAQAFSASAADDGCNTADHDQLCAAKVRNIDGALTVQAATDGDYFKN